MNYKTNRALCALLITLFCALALTMPAAAQQRAIINPSTELPSFPISSNQRWGEGALTGWFTTHPAAMCDNGTGSNNIPCRPIERWSTGFLETFTATGAGNSFVELNADVNSMIYQPVCMTSGETFSYSFVHRGRGSDTTPDVAQFRLGIPAGLPAGSKAANAYSYPIVQVATTSNGIVAVPPTGSGTINAPVAAGNGWQRYSGTYTYTGPTQTVNMGFQAVGSSGGISYGNFIDDWQISLDPHIELSADSAEGSEGTTAGGNTPSNRPSIRIGGQVTAPVTVNIQVTGGNADIGEDYSMTVPFESGNTDLAVSIVIPPGTYDAQSSASIFPIPFSINADHTPETDETVSFEVTSVVGAVTAAIATCGAAPTVGMSYTILNDDLAPTAGKVTIAGRVVTAEGRGIPGAGVEMITSQGLLRTITSAMGYFSLEGPAAGEFIVVNVSSKRHKFVRPSIAFPVVDNVADLLFTAR